MYGEGLLKGLGVTIKYFFSPKVTELYPEVKPKLPPAVKSCFRLDEEKCIACGLCARACPNGVITVLTEKDENNKKRLTAYEMNLQYCLYCGLCEESCPTDAIIIDQDFELAAYSREGTKKKMYQICRADFPEPPVTVAKEKPEIKKVKIEKVEVTDKIEVAKKEDVTDKIEVAKKEVLVDKVEEAGKGGRDA